MSKKIGSWRVPPKPGYSDSIPASELFKSLGIPASEVDKIFPPTQDNKGKK